MRLDVKGDHPQQNIPADEPEIIARLRAKDQAALDLLYTRYSGLVYSLALRIVRQPADAEDVVIECFWQVWQQAADYNDERGQLRAWIVTITRSRALDRLRTMRRNPSEELEEFNQPSAGDNPEEETWQNEQSSIVRQALVSLPADQRQALELAYYHGLSQSEVAGKLGEPLGTIKTRMRLGMMKLRDQLRHLRGQ
jgi:RNA polymerase sigma-70 factor, ECF subfamily